MRQVLAAFFLMLSLMAPTPLLAEGLFGESGDEEICADDLGMSVRLNINGEEVQTGSCENMDPDMDYSKLNTKEVREYIQDSQGTTR